MRAGRLVVGAVAAVVLAGGGVIAANAVKANIETSQKCEAVKPFVPVKHISDRKPSVAILGDSYTAGDGLTDRTKGWAYKIGTDIAGVGMTGYVNGGYCGDGTFVQRIDALLATHPDTLIIQGGLNDWGSPEKVADAAVRVLDKAKAVPHLIVVGPADVPGRDNEDKVDMALRAATALTNTKYVSALGWKLDFLPDNTHLTEAGHATFATNVAGSLKS